MPRRLTKEKTHIRLPETQIRRIDALADSWSHETRAFMRARLNQYQPGYRVFKWMKAFFSHLFSLRRKNRRMHVLNDPDILTDWKKRFKYSGETHPAKSWNKIIEKELTPAERKYLLSVLDTHLTDIHVPVEVETIIEKIYRAHIRKEYLSGQDVPKAPLLLVEGSSGSGKTATVQEALDKIIFRDEVVPSIDWRVKRDEILARHGIFTSLEQVDPEFAMAIALRRVRRFYRRLSRIPLVNRMFKKRIMERLSIPKSLEIS